MRSTTLAFLTVAAFRSLVLGQPIPESPVERTLPFVHTETVRDMQEIATAVRTIADIKEVYVDTAKRSTMLRGPATYVNLAEWLFKNLDQPVNGPSDTAPNEYRLAGDGEAAVRIFHIRNAATITEFQEIAVAARTATEIRRVYTYNAGRAIVTRGTAAQIAMAEWIFAKFDQPLDAPKQHSSADEYRVPASGDDVVRMFYAAHADSVKDFQELATLLRTMTDIRRVFTYNELRAVVLRAKPDQIAMAEWLFDRLDKLASESSPDAAAAEYRVPTSADDIVRVFYLASPASVEELQKTATQIRGAGNFQRVYVLSATHAMALRGTTDQMAVAQRLLAAPK